MTNPNTKEYWQDIFDSIDMEYLPLEYVEKILITFNDGTIWDIDINDSRKKQTIEQIEKSLDELFELYESKMDKIDFRLDLKRIQSDLSKRVYKFLKLNR